MTQVFLTTASSSPWSVPGDFDPAGHTVELLGAGGNGATGTTGANPRGGGGGSAGGYGLFTYASGSVGASIDFLVGAGGAQTGAVWQQTSQVTDSLNAYSGNNASGSTGGSNIVDADISGTPAITYTRTIHSFGGNGGSVAATNRGGAGGGAAGGPSGAGKNGGSPAASGTGGCGGGGANGGSSTAGANTSSGTFGAGGAGNGGSGGGATSGTAGTAGTGGGGAGTTAVASGSAGTGGAGSAHTTSGPWDATHGPGGGGGGGGQVTGNSGGETSNGGNGGLYGGGGGGTGGLRGSGSQTVGAGQDGLIAITYTPAAAITWLEAMSSTFLMPFRHYVKEVVGY